MQATYLQLDLLGGNNFSDFVIGLHSSDPFTQTFTGVGSFLDQFRNKFRIWNVFVPR